MRAGLATPLMAGFLILAAVTVLADSFPRPSPIPYRWEMDFQPGALRLYVDRPTGDTYWYFTYMITNDTGRDRMWAPQFVLFTDHGGIQRSGEGVPREIMQDILNLLDNDLLELDFIGDIYQGEENAREGLVVWRADELDITEVSLFIAGISGETARVTNPLTGEVVLMRKTLQRDYVVPGNPEARGSTPVELVSQRWILR